MITKKNKHFTFWKTKKVFVWEKLTITRILFCLVLSLVYGRLKVFFIESSYPLTYIKKVLNPKKPIFTFIKKLDLGDISRNDYSNNSLRYKVEELSWQQVEAHFSGINLSIAAYQKEEQYWKKIIFSWFILKTRKKLETFYLVENFLNENFAEEPVTVFMDSIPIMENLYKCIPRAYHRKIIKCLNLKDYLFPFLAICYVISNLLLSVFNRQSIKTNLSTSNNSFKIFEQYIHNIFVNYPFSGCLFWYPDSGITSDRVVLYFDRKDSRCTEKAIREIDHRKFSWIDIFYKRNFHLSGINFFYKVCGIARPQKIRKSYIDLYFLQIYFLYIVEWYRLVLRKNNVKVVHQHIEPSHDSLSLALATKLESGIFVWNHWSVDHYPVAYFNIGFADLIFSWGPYNDAYFNSHGYKYDYMLQTGLVAADNTSINDKENGIYLRKSFNIRVNFIITLFDSSYSDDHINSTTMKMEHFYKQTLTMIAENKNWGVIIKSKGLYFQNLLKKKSILRLVDKLVVENRCVIAEAFSSVIPASYASDICLCYGINSAGFIAGIAGKNVIYWDIMEQHRHPLYKLNLYKNVVFRSFQEIDSKLKEYSDRKIEIRSHEKIVEMIDPFRDWKGGERAGHVIKKFLSEVDRGSSKEQALEVAVEEFKQKWGCNKVTKFGQKKESEVGDVWTSIRDDIRKSIIYEKKRKWDN